METHPNQPTIVSNIAVVTNIISYWFPSLSVVSMAKSKAHYDILVLVALGSA